MTHVNLLDRCPGFVEAFSYLATRIPDFSVNVGKVPQSFSPLTLPPIVVVNPVDHPELTGGHQFHKHPEETVASLRQNLGNSSEIVILTTLAPNNFALDEIRGMVGDVTVFLKGQVPVAQILGELKQIHTTRQQFVKGITSIGEKALELFSKKLLAAATLVENGDRAGAVSAIHDLKPLIRFYRQKLTLAYPAQHGTTTPRSEDPKQQARMNYILDTIAQRLSTLGSPLSAGVDDHADEALKELVVHLTTESDAMKNDLRILEKTWL
jgi:hypothetical protein